MDCTICGKPTLPGAKLCAPCKAALKRARYVTVQEDMRRPSVIDVKRQPRHARPPVAAPASGAVPPLPARVRHHAAPAPPVSSEPNSMLGRRIFVGIFVVVGLLGTAGYFGLRELGAHAGDAVTAREAPAVEPRRETSASVAASRSEEPASPLANSAGTASAAVVGPDPLVLQAPKPPAKRAQLDSRATFATANGDPPEAIYVAPEPEKPAPAPAPPPPAPDRWQSMREAQSQCDREGVLNGLICSQRVKMQFCDGYWGKVVQCQGASVPYER